MSYIGNSPGVASQRVTTTLTATLGQTQFTTQSGYVLGYVDVFLNGSKLINGVDFEAISSTYITLFEPAIAGDTVELVSYVPRGLSDGYTKAEADAKFLDVGGDAATGALSLTAATLSGDLTLNGGTVGGVGYLNGSKVLTTGSALTFDGTNLGVGGAASGSRLHVMSAGGVSAKVENTANTGATFFQAKNTSGSSYLGQDATGGYLLTDYAAPFLFYINNAEQMRLTGTGLGIGTSSPASKLDVAGGIQANSVKVGTTQAIITSGMWYQSGTAQLKFSPPAGGFGWNRNANDAEIMALTDSGNLGLGVTPSAWGSAWKAFDESAVGSLAASPSGSGDFGLIFNAYNDNTNWRYKYTGDPATRYTISLGQHRFFTAPSGTAGNAISFTQAMTLTAAGNLGIGTTSPSAKLHVTATSGVYNAAVLNANDIGGGVLIRGASSGSSSRVGLFFQGSDAIGAAIAAAREDSGLTWKTYLSFYTNNLTGGNVQDLQEKMRINSNGALVLQGGDILASGVGIAFPATQSASSNANTLDDYEEGSWTPALAGAGSPTYSENYGRYIKIGRLVTLVGKIAVSGVTSSSNAITVTGLPFTVQDANDGAQRACSFMSGDVQLMGPYVASAALRTESTYLVGVRDNGSGSTVFWLYSELSSTSFEFSINITYLATT